MGGGGYRLGYARRVNILLCIGSIIVVYSIKNARFIAVGLRLIRHFVRIIDIALQPVIFGILFVKLGSFGYIFI